MSLICFTFLSTDKLDPKNPLIFGLSCIISSVMINLVPKMVDSHKPLSLIMGLLSRNSQIVQLSDLAEHFASNILKQTIYNMVKRDNVTLWNWQYLPFELIFKQFCAVPPFGSPAFQSRSVGKPDSYLVKLEIASNRPSIALSVQPKFSLSQCWRLKFRYLRNRKRNRK